MKRIHLSVASWCFQDVRANLGLWLPLSLFCSLSCSHSTHRTFGKQQWQQLHDSLSSWKANLAAVKTSLQALSPSAWSQLKPRLSRPADTLLSFHIPDFQTELISFYIPSIKEQWRPYLCFFFLFLLVDIYVPQYRHSSNRHTLLFTLSNVQDASLFLVQRLWPSASC